MNDRLKFRVWNPDVESYDDDPQYNVDIKIDQENGLVLTPFRNNIIEFCTGLSDKNGKLIYEGDIIHEVDKDADIDDVSQIVWNQDTCHFMRLDLPDTKLNRHCLICEADSPYIEIIGNIHEQPEQKD